MLQLNVGDRASLTCSVVKGDVPLTISWRKDGRAIELSSQHMSVKSVDQYNSILVIENLIADHTGNYSCCVRNLAAEVESAQSLLVNGNPRERCNALFIRCVGRASVLSARVRLRGVRIRHSLHCTRRTYIARHDHNRDTQRLTSKRLVFRFSHICFFFLSLHSSSPYYWAFFLPRRTGRGYANAYRLWCFKRWFATNTSLA